MGMRGDLDPYRYTDYAALHRLVSAAALAFAHSVEYAQRQEAEAIIRQLYRRLQTERDAMAQDLAQSIHDDILNGNLRLNIEALRNVAMINTNLMLEDNINLALETMEALGGDLRSICEDLHPTGLDDPLGLSAVVRIEVQKMQARWHGQCQFQEIGMPQPIAAAIQREVLRITKEALVNVEKHARAESVVVYLHYPSTYGEHIQLTIRDNGCTGQLIAPRFGHLGVRQMLENARTIGGLLEFGQQLGKGTTVKLLFPPSLRSMHNDDRASEDNPPTTFAV
jgi:signal transduction histidine kinase